MTTEKKTSANKTKIFRKKKGSDEDVISKVHKQVSKKFPNRDFEVKIASDDGGRVIEIHINESNLSRQVRDLMPLNWEGWRTVVINRYAVSGAE
jgi:hypothetical protein